MRSTLVVAEIALALVLLVGAGLLLRSFSALTRVSPGFDPRNLLVINVPLSPRTYGDHVVRTAAVDRIVERVAALPGVERAADQHDDPDGRSRSDHPFQPRRLSAQRA